MWFYNILSVVIGIIVAIAALYLLFRLFVLKQGNEKVILLPKRATNFQVSDRNFESITLFCDIPFVNKGRQLGTIMDLFPRPLLPEEHFDAVKVDAWAMDINRPRHDGYFEAVIIKPRKGGTIRVFVTLVCVPTRILTDNDDIVDAIVEFGGHNIGPEDIVCVAESVVAITQGRFTRPEELDVCWQARLINRFIHPDGSMASIYGMQSAMNLDGKWKVLGAFILGAIAKIFRKPGVFYAIARAASLTDDVTGTMPPFDKHIVFGPKDPDKVAEKIVSRTGCYGAVVADVNDLKRSAVLGTSRGIDGNKIAQLLIDNPFGNDSQMTPIVIIKNYASVSGK